jgi:uncharacterized protein
VGAKVISQSVLDQRLTANPKLKILFDRAQSIKAVDAAHDFSHILRVAKLTAEIYGLEIKSRHFRDLTADEIDAALVSALLHDCVPVTKDSPLRKESSRLASDQARKWLHEIEWNPSQIEDISSAVLTHSFSANIAPTSMLGEALQDADRLEALGALGLFRTIATGVSMGAEFFDKLDPWAEKRALDDQKYTIDHFQTKLLKLPLTFKTAAAKTEAKQRADYLEQFLMQLKREIS